MDYLPSIVPVSAFAKMNILDVNQFFSEKHVRHIIVRIYAQYLWVVAFCLAICQSWNARALILQEGKVAITKVAELLLCIYADKDVQLGLLRAKVYQFDYLLVKSSRKATGFFVCQDFKIHVVGQEHWRVAKYNIGKLHRYIFHTKLLLAITFEGSR